jgi:phenylpyruvate tautomerase
MPFLKISTNKAVDIAAQTFGGTDEDTAFLEIKSIGLSNEQAGILAEEIPLLVEEKLGINPSRIYIEFSDAPRSFWGWNKGTF